MTPAASPVNPRDLTGANGLLGAPGAWLSLDL